MVVDAKINDSLCYASCVTTSALICIYSEETMQVLLTEQGSTTGARVAAVSPPDHNTQLDIQKTTLAPDH